MKKLYDQVVVKKTGKHANIIEIDDDGGTKPPIYLVEICDSEKGDFDDINEVVFWCEDNEIE